MTALSQHQRNHSPNEQLALLDARLGKGIGAKKERARLLQLISPKNEEPKKSRAIILPDANEMLRLLHTVYGGSHADQGFYPLILKYAGTSKVAAGIVMMLVLSIDEYIKNERLPYIMYGMLNSDIPRYIDAIVDDKEVRDEAKTFYEKVVSDADAAREARIAAKAN